VPPKLESVLDSCGVNGVVLSVDSVTINVVSEAKDDVLVVEVNADDVVL